MREGFVTSDGGRVWYGIEEPTSDSRPVPLLTLHGGPGGAHYCLEPLSSLAGVGRTVVFYDQLGCGRSDPTSDPDLWTVERFVDEIDEVRNQLGLTECHLLGLSWGGMLALEYAARNPPGLRSLVIASAPSSTAQWIRSCNEVRAGLPLDVQETLAQHEADGTTSSPEYYEAMMVFYRNHVCRSDPWPDCVQKSVAEMDKSPIYAYMNGPSEFFAPGTLRDWSIEAELWKINVPTLITSGRYDEFTPTAAADLTGRIAGARSIVFENSAHFAHAEEPDRYMRAVDEFLTEVEGGRR